MNTTPITPLPRTLQVYINRLADAPAPLSFTQIVAATPGVNLFRLLKERGLIRNVVPNYVEHPGPPRPKKIVVKMPNSPGRSDKLENVFHAMTVGDLNELESYSAGCSGLVGLARFGTSKKGCDHVLFISRRRIDPGVTKEWVTGRGDVPQRISIARAILNHSLRFDTLPLRVPHYVLTDAGRACLGCRHVFCQWCGLERRGVLAVWCASFVLDRPARPAARRDEQHVRGLAARVLYDLGKLSWSDVALAVYRRRVHNTALTAARRWTATPEAALAREILRRVLDPTPDTPTPTPSTQMETPDGP